MDMLVRLRGVVIILRLEVERRKRGWSQARLARETGIHPTDISKLEAGQVHPWPGWRKRLAEALGVEEAVLFREVKEVE